MFQKFTADQKIAEAMIEDWFFNSDSPVFVLAGYAGTGKSTLIRHAVTHKLKLIPDISCAFVTPTGKAATVLIKDGTNASTLHRLIYQPYIEKQVVSVNGKTITVDKLSFKRREKIDKEIKLIVLDEASMVSDGVLWDLMEYNIKLLLCGDNAQLPPIEGLNSYLKNPNFTLTTIVRQELDNPIIQLATAAREGQYIRYGNYADRVSVVKRDIFKGEARKHCLLTADQVICGLNKTRAIINDEIRTYKKFGKLPEDGEKLICTQNNWTQYIDKNYKFNLVNGIIGTAHDIVIEADDIGFMQFKPDFLNEYCPQIIPFDVGIFSNGKYRYKTDDYFEKDNGTDEGTAFTLNRLEYGYCISCHKAQGSEFDKVVVFDESYAFKEDKNRWLYTAITRAKERLILVR